MIYLDYDETYLRMLLRGQLMLYHHFLSEFSVLPTEASAAEIYVFTMESSLEIFDPMSAKLRVSLLLSRTIFESF